MSPLNIYSYKNFRKDFLWKISKACTLPRETIVLQVENAIFQKWPPNIAKIINNSNSIIQF